MTTPLRARLRTARQRLVARVTAATDQLAAIWAILPAAQRALLRVLARIRPGRTATPRIRAAISAFNHALAEFDRQAAAFAARWSAVDLPAMYRDGARQALAAIDHDPDAWQWTMNHQAAITSITGSYYSDLMGRITEALRRARAFLRAAQEQARTQRGVDTGQLLRDHPLGTVVYANTARHPVHAWASSSLTWQAVTTANAGAARTALWDLNCQWMEVRDGSGCGWTEHNDPDEAHGSLRTVQDALAHPAAHPHCRREFLPRPDIRHGDDFV